MKKILLLIILNTLFYSSDLYPQSGWFWNNPSPQGNDMYDVIFADKNTGWIVGDVGSILKTTDGADSWSLQKTNSNQYMRAIYVIDYNNVYICGYNGDVVKTTNGGTNWIAKNTGTNILLLSVHFENINIGWIGGEGGLVYKTTNGGVNWIDQSLGISNKVISICFINNNTGYLTCTGGVIKKTTNGGANWENPTGFPVSGTYVNVWFNNPNQGFIATNSYIYRSTDGGLSWVGVFSVGINININKMHFFNENLGFAVYSWQSMYWWGYKSTFTKNGGNSFSNYDISITTNATGLTVFDTSKAIVLTGSSNIMITPNSGAGYYNINAGPTTNFVFANFINENSGYVAGDKSLYRTYDGGINYYPAKITTNAISTGCFPSLNTGYLFANNYIHKTTNAANSWIDVQTQFVNIRKCFFLNNNTGWFVAESGRVMKTTDGSSNWNVYLTGYNNQHYDVFFADNNTGWTIPNSGNSIYKSTNGGVNWYTQNLGLTSSMYQNSLYFYDNNIGWIAGNKILYTVNGGVNWIQQYDVGTDDQLSNIKFVNQFTGWAVGKNGGILCTTNCGANWYWQEKITNKNITGISIVSPSIVYVAGNSGIILKTTSGGNVWVKKIDDLIPDEYSLFQNYPNPFNPVTKIKFVMPKQGFVEIKVFDLLGREVKILMNENLKPGTYETSFNGLELTSGVYFYRMTTESFTETKRMVLLK